MATQSDTPPSNAEQPAATRLIAVVVLFVWAGIILGSSQAGTMRLWGVNHLAFTPHGLIWRFAAAVVIATLLVLYPRHVRLFPFSHAHKHAPWRYGLLLATVVGFAGWVLRAQVGLLGDGIMRASDALNIATPMPSELLPSALSMFLARDLPGSWGVDGYGALSIISIASGVVLMLGLWWLAPKTGIKRPYWFIFWILTFGSFRLFAGYLETYAPAVAFGILWTVAAIAYRKGNTGAPTVIVLWVLAFLSHATMLLIAPATIFVLFWGREKPRPNWRPAIVFAVIAAGLGITIGVRMHELQIGGLGAGTGYFFLSLLSDPKHKYGIISPFHLVDLQNQLVLLTPAFFVALLARLPSVMRGHRVSGATQQAGQQRRETIIFWTLAAGVPIVVGMMIDPKLGWARDWDLFTLFFTPFMVGAALWLARLNASPVRRAAASVALISLGLWLVFSVDADAETRRFKALLELDPSRGDYGHEILALHYREINQPNNEIEQYKQALAISDNIRYRGNIAAACIRAGRYDESIEWYQSILDRDSTFDVAVYGMAVALQYVGRFADALPYAEKAASNMPRDPERQYTLGAIESRLLDFQSALPHLEFAVRARPDDIDYLNPLGGCYLQLKRYQEARTVWHQVMKLNPTFSPVYLNAASLELTTQNLAESRRLLDEYERLVPADKRRPEAQWLADSLTRAGH